MQFACSHILLDACCVLNFCASGNLLTILRSIPVRVAVTQVVQERELLSLQSLEDEENDGRIQFETAIAEGLIIVTDFSSEEEAESFINYAAVLGDDGESATCAIAIHRGWAIATDDRKAIAFMNREASHLQVFSTLEIIKYWSEATNLDTSKLYDVLQAIRVKGRYLPPRNHPLKSWWDLASTNVDP